MKLSKKAYLFVLPLLSSTSYLSSTGYAMEDLYEEKTFVSSEIKGLKFKTDTGNIDIGLSTEETSKVQFKKVSGEGNVKFSMTGGELNIESTNSPNGGCNVNYKAYVPKGTPVSIITGKSNIGVENMGDLDITAGSMFLKARNIFGSVNLQYSSGEAEVKYDELPQYPYSSTINSSSGKTTFYLPPESTVKINAAKPQLVESDFMSSLKAHFSFMFNSSSGKLNIKKN